MTHQRQQDTPRQRERQEASWCSLLLSRCDPIVYLSVLCACVLLSRRRTYRKFFVYEERQQRRGFLRTGGKRAAGVLLLRYVSVAMPAVANQKEEPALASMRKMPTCQHASTRGVKAVRRNQGFPSGKLKSSTRSPYPSVSMTPAYSGTPFSEPAVGHEPELGPPH